MPYSNKQMLRDVNGDLIPQYWDVVEQDFKPLTGQGGANDVRLTGSIVEELYLQNGEITLEAGEAYRILDHFAVDMNKINKVLISIEGINVDVRYYNTVYEGSGNLFRKYLDDSNAIFTPYANRRLFEEKVYTRKITVEIRNSGDSETTFRQASVIGIWR